MLNRVLHRLTCTQIPFGFGTLAIILARPPQSWQRRPSELTHSAKRDSGGAPGHPKFGGVFQHVDERFNGIGMPQLRKGHSSTNADKIRIAQSFYQCRHGSLITELAEIVGGAGTRHHCFDVKIGFWLSA